MFLYDLIAPGYDLFLRRFYRPFRTRAFEHLPVMKGASVLDLCCGTGQNFPLLAAHVGLHGKIVGLDRSSGMLRGARRSLTRCPSVEGILLHQDANKLSYDILHRQTKLRSVDMVVCTFGFSTMREWKISFHRSFDLLKPGGMYLILDVHAQKKTVHARAVEAFTHSYFSRETWHYLENLCPDFHLEYLDPSTYLFGGRVFVAYGTKVPVDR